MPIMPAPVVLGLPNVSVPSSYDDVTRYMLIAETE